MRYRKKNPQVFDAVRWSGNNLDEVEEFLYPQRVRVSGVRISLPGESGVEFAWPGDWILKDQDGSPIVCTSYAFEKYYEPVEA